MNPHQQPPRINNYVYYILSIFVSGMIICATILYVSGSLNFVKVQFNDLIPRFPSYQKLSDIKDYTNQEEIFGAQPQIFYSDAARKYLLVEVSDLNCPNCAKFHGYGSVDGEYGYNRFKQDYLATGKVSYMFLDQRFLVNADKHISAYCVAEQSPKKFFEYKDALYKDYDKPFTLAISESYLDALNFNMKQYEDCFNSKKYDKRIQEISNFSANYFNASSTPTFMMFKVDETAITRIDGSKGVQRKYTQLFSILGNVDYDSLMQPKIEAGLKK